MKDEEDDYETFKKWFKENEMKFCDAMYSDRDVAYSAWVKGREYERLKESRESDLKNIKEDIEQGGKR